MSDLTNNELSLGEFNFDNGAGDVHEEEAQGEEDIDFNQDLGESQPMSASQIPELLRQVSETSQQPHFPVLRPNKDVINLMSDSESDDEEPFTNGHPVPFTFQPKRAVVPQRSLTAAEIRHNNFCAQREVVEVFDQEALLRQVDSDHYVEFRQKCEDGGYTHVLAQPQLFSKLEYDHTDPPLVERIKMAVIVMEYCNELKRVAMPAPVIHTLSVEERRQRSHLAQQMTMQPRRFEEAKEWQAKEDKKNLAKAKKSGSKRKPEGQEGEEAPKKKKRSAPKTKTPVMASSSSSATAEDCAKLQAAAELDALAEACLEEDLGETIKVSAKDFEHEDMWGDQDEM